ncbi:MAG: glutamate--tRNA ligase [Gammaproteobacteria bacterium]|nr:glutamate--tRNA ligase [Gammaproteobacteria bacterium]MDJ0890267.1 glutamate--tRNA ligase [Gammaproteobacteria bacterium]
MTVRTRFAPSPTGYLHVGGARTALFSWLHARKHGGHFILRIEDTDLERSTPESVNAILEGMAWLGLDYDEGPFFQTRRFDRYDEVIKELLAAGQAYRCDCSKERLDALRGRQMRNKQKPRYDGRCRARDVDPEQPHVVRFRTPLEGATVIEDLVQGRVVLPNSELDDVIVRRSDGSPTYNLSVVVDDMDMEVTHVIRGDDHLNNTPRQVQILRALGKPLPVYAHVPMILGEDGARLSKRHGAVSVVQYRDAGFLPEALLNYLVRLGWSHGDDEVFTLDEMLEFFDLSDVNKAASRFDSEKLLWLNQVYIKSSAPEHVARHLSEQLGRLGIDPTTGPDPVGVALAQRERAKTVLEMAENSVYFYQDYDEMDVRAASKHLRPVALEPMALLRDRLASLGDWSAPRIHDAITGTAESLHLKLGKLAQPLRVAATGRGVSPPIDVTLELLGKERALQRIDGALAYIRARVEQG